MRIPTQAVALLSRFHSPEMLRRVDLVFAPLSLGATPPRTLAVPQALQAIGASPRPGLIVIAPTALGPDTPARLFTTARGLALVAHEACHQEQWETIPDFALRYEQAEMQRMAAGGMPWDNVYEAPCYAQESQVLAYFASLGYPMRSADSSPYEASPDYSRVTWQLM